MTSVIRIEPSAFRPLDEAWFIMSDGRKLLRKLKREVNACRSNFPCPAIRSDRIDDVKSMADGKVYDSLSGLYASYRADGNPQGIAYECIGNDTKALEQYVPPPRDDRKAHEAITRTLDEAGF